MKFEKWYKICRNIKIPEKAKGVTRVFSIEANGLIIESVPFTIKDGFIVVENWEKYVRYHTVMKDGRIEYLEDLFYVEFYL